MNSPWKFRLMAICIVAAVLAQGCEYRVGPPPVNMMEYSRMRRRLPPAYPDYTVFNYNLRRVSDAKLSADARVDSPNLAIKLGGDEPTIIGGLASVLEQPDTPVRLHYAALEFLLRKGNPAIAPYAVKALDNRYLPASLRDAILGWLTVNARPEVLAQVVKLWAQEKSITGLNEPRYRQIVERISGKNWVRALLLGINTPRFFARGSALEILAARLDEDMLRGRILRMIPATTAMDTLQEFIRQLDYLPVSKTDFLAAARIYSTRRDMLSDAARISRKWHKRQDYSFVISDFHLLSRLNRDPLRRDMKRSELIVDLGRAVSLRRHVVRARQPGMPAGSHTDSFAVQIESLTMTDLWNLYLLNEMLGRPRVQLALRIMSERDRADLRSAWGGLVVYENGQAEASLYPAATGTAGGDLHYVAGRQMIADGHDALCRFCAHFEKIDNAARVGPDADELRQARRGNYYGLVLTSIDENTFTAHYYNSMGIVVSLGNFPFRG